VDAEMQAIWRQISVESYLCKVKNRCDEFIYIIGIKFIGSLTCVLKCPRFPHEQSLDLQKDALKNAGCKNWCCKMIPAGAHHDGRSLSALVFFTLYDHPMPF
jgi:hypothetical protein